MKKKKIYHKLKNLGVAFYWLAFALLVGIALIAAVSAFNIFGKFRLLIVQSGSMSPSIPMGSLVITKPSDEYKVNDVVTFYDQDTRYLITHRIEGIEKLEEGELFITKGDANEDEDGRRVDKDSVVGEVVWALPLVGYAISFAKTQTGLILLIIIPATLIVYSEFLAIKSEIKKLKKRTNGKRLAVRKFYLPKLLGLILLISLIPVGRSESYYTDSETTSGGFSAAECFDEDYCDESEEDPEESETELSFYFRDDNLAVGFNIQGVSGYDSLDYAIDYEYDPGIPAHIEGTIDNSSHNDSYVREWFLLGTCSDLGEVCVYHEGIGEITLTVDLFVGGVLQETLTQTLNLTI